VIESSFYPKEYLYSIEKNRDLELLLSVGLNEEDNTFWVEALIVFHSSKKIFKSIGKKYNLHDERFAVSEGLRMYRSFLNS